MQYYSYLVGGHFLLQVYINDHPQYVKVIDMQGHMEHIPWAKVYKRMLSAASIDPPGYIIHESAYWSDIHKKWFFLPRRASKDRYVPMGLYEHNVWFRRKACGMYIQAHIGLLINQRSEWDGLKALVYFVVVFCQLFFSFILFCIVNLGKDSKIFLIKSTEFSANVL